MKNLIIISGPTAVGKTDLSLSMAERVGGEIISADSMQVYKGFDIGTAKISTDQMRGIKHHLIDILGPDEEFNVYEFKKRSDICIREISERGFIPIIVGGTGFYIQSVLYDIEFTDEESDTAYRDELLRSAASYGSEYIYRLLEKADPQAAEHIHPNNVKKVVRALCFCHETGSRFSEHNDEQRLRESPYNYAYFVLNRDRSELYRRINTRVDLMLQQGLVQEVKGLLDSGIRRDSLAMQGLGYKEIIRYLDGCLSLEEAAEEIRKGSRHFAKRQITWFKREKDVIWMNYEDHPDEKALLSSMMEILHKKGIIGKD